MYFDENTMKNGRVSKLCIHKNAMKFIKYIFKDGSYVEKITKIVISLDELMTIFYRF